MTNKTYLKQDIRLKEDTDRNYAVTTDCSNASPSELINKTKAEHSDADSVTIPGKEMDGDSNTQVATVNINNTSQDLQNAQKMAKTFQSQGQDVNFKVNLHNSVQREGNLVECVTFTKKELSNFLKSI